MKLSDLKYLGVIEETKSFTKTAEIFMVSQPVVSISIKRLEKEFNRKIVSREKFNSDIKLTETGELLFEFYNNVNKEIELIRKEFEQDDNQIIYIGIKNAEVDLLLRMKMALMYEKYDRIKKEFNVFHASENILNKGLLTGKLKWKISISNDEKTYSDIIKKKFIQKLNYCIVKNKKETSINKLKDLKGKKIIALNDNFQTEKLHKILDKNNIVIDEIIYVKSLKLAQILIKNSVGIGIFLNDILEESDYIEKINISESEYLCLEYITDDLIEYFEEIFS